MYYLPGILLALVVGNGVDSLLGLVIGDREDP